MKSPLFNFPTMNNLILSTILKPRKRSGTDKWNEFLESMGEARCLWYPSAGMDFRDLLFMHPHYYLMKNFAPPVYPEVYIHTDYYPWQDEPFLNKDILHDDGRTKVELLEKTELIIPSNITFSDERYITFNTQNDLSGRIFLLKVRISSDRLNVFERYVLYFFHENVTFFKEFLMKTNLKIFSIMNIVDGSRMGGNRFSLKFLELYLGLLETEWLISDNLDDEPDFDFIKKDLQLQKLLYNIDNTPTSLQHYGQISRLRYGPVMCARVGQISKFSNREIRKTSRFQKKSIY